MVEQLYNRGEYGVSRVIFMVDECSRRVKRAESNTPHMGMFPQTFKTE